MPGMSTPIVIEAGIALEPVTADPFVADLVDYRSPEAAARVADLLARAATGPRRRIYD